MFLVEAYDDKGKLVVEDELGEEEGLELTGTAVHSGRSYRPYAYHPSRRSYYPSTASEPNSPSPAPKTKVISIPVHGPDTNISTSPLVPVLTPDANNRKLVDSGNAARMIQKVVRDFLVTKNLKIFRKFSGEADEITQQISPEMIRGSDKELEEESWDWRMVEGELEEECRLFHRPVRDDGWLTIRYRGLLEADSVKDFAS